MSFLSGLALLAQTVCVQPAQSHFMIHVESGGLFGAFGHDHLIEATQIKGCAMIDWDNMEQSSVNLAFASAGVKVLDPDHPSDRPQVQMEMETRVLDMNEFPAIQFKSTAVRVKALTLSLDGVLTIHGQDRNVTIPLQLERRGQNAVRVSGRYVVRQSAFGIKPTRVAGGLVRVKDEVQCEFDLVLQQ